MTFLPDSNPMADFARGFSMPLRAARLLLTHRGVKRIAVLPLIANVIIYAAAFILVIWLVSVLDLSVSQWEFWGPVGGWLSTGLNWTTGALKWVLAIPLFLIATYFTFTMIGMVAAAPFNDLLSARVERRLCAPEDEQNLPLGLTAKLMILSVLDALQIVGMQVLAMVLCLPLLLIPIVGAIPLFCVVAYFSGLGYFDTATARNNLRWKHKSPMIAERRWMIFGFGVAMELMFLVPFVGLLLLPIGVTAGTIIYCRSDWRQMMKARAMEPPPGFMPPRPQVSMLPTT